MSYTSDFLKELEKLSKKTTSTAQKAKRRADITVGKQSEDKFTRDFFTELYKLEEEEALKKNQEKEKTRFDDSNKARSSKKRNGGGGRSFDEEEEDKWGNRKSFVLDSLRGLGAPTASGTLSKKETQSSGGGSFAKKDSSYVDIGGGYKINKKTKTLVDENHVQIGKYDEDTEIVKSDDGTRYFRIKEDGSLRWYDEGMKALGFSDNNSWFQAGAFEDGYDLWDGVKSILSTGRQLGRGVVRGVVNIGETTIDTAAYLGGLAGKGIGYLAGADDSEIAGWDNMVSEFIAKDIINEDAIAKVVVPDLVSALTNGQQTEEENALVGGKMTGLAESAGQIVLQAGLQSVGVPWFVTSGVSSFGSETENALKQDATLGEAGFSASVSALGEIATEKIFGAFKFQGKGLDDGLKTAISRNIKNKTLRTLANFSLDYGGEGVEELLSGGISAAGQKLSYATDKEIKELFSSEDAWDAFIGGSILGGGTNVANIVKSAVNKVDPVTHLTENEQKVVDRVYKDAVDEAEKDGKKLDGTEKNKLYDGILKNLEKGYISTDIIEEVLGGDTYKQYKDTIDSEDAAMKEFEDLYEGEELEQQKNSFKEHSKLDSIREQLGIEVSDKVKGDRLIESYNEKIRRGQSFVADLTKYSDKAQAVVQKAMNSGVLNNTNRSHELVDLVAKIAGDKGIDFDFTNNEKLKESGFAIEGSTINGFVTKDGVTLNVQSKKALNSVVGHEIAHVLEGTELYNELQKIAFEYAETKGEYKDRLRRANEAYRNVEGYQGVDGFNKIKSEVLADIVGDYLFTDPDFINTLSTNHRNVFQKMYDEVKYLHKIATAGSKEARELEKLKKAFDNAYRAATSTDSKTNTQYSISTDSTYMDAVNHGDMNTAQRMVEDFAKVAGYDTTMFHETDADNIHIFDISRGTHGGTDYQTPYGIFTKSSAKNIGLGSKQMKLFVKAENTLRVEDRDDVLNKIPGFAKYYDQIQAIDQKYDAISEQLEDEEFDALQEWMEANPDADMDVVYPTSYIVEGKPADIDSERYQEAHRKYQENHQAWEEEYNAVAVKAKEFITNYLRGNGYDSMYFKIDGGSRGRQTDSLIVLDENQVKSADAVTYDDNGNVIPLSERFNPQKDDIRYSLSSIANTFFGDENMSAYEFKNANYTETQGYKDYVEQCLNNYRQSRTDFDEGKARKAIEDSIHGIVRVAIASKEAGYDIYDDATKRSKKDSKKRLLFSSLEPNSDYFTSNDISTICDKRKNFAEIYDDIVKAEEKKGVPPGKRFFDNVDNYFYLHKLMADKGLTQPCRQCYVESMRKNLAPMANAFLRLVKETNPNNMANDQLYHQKGKNKGGIKTNNAATRMWVIEKLAEYGMTVNDLSVQTLTTEDGLAQLKIQAPMIYEAFNSFYGQSKPKMPKAATPFRFGELTALLTDEHGKIKKSLVDKINATGGFRLQSYSDFQIQNYTDVLQAIFEAGTLGLKGHAYTKVPAFLDATEGTNLKRNISIFMYKDGDEWKLDKNDSFPYELEEIYDIVNADETGNTGIIAVSQNTDMSAWIMANDYVGYGIPFHKSGLKMGTVRDTVVKTDDGREVKGYTGTKDHTKQQTEVWAKSSADHKALTKVKKGINIYEFWDFANKENLTKNELIEKNVKAYIDACEEAGYLPKFREYVMNNGAVLNAVLKYAKQLGFASQDATIDDIAFEYKGYTIPYGYYKFLGDFGMFTPDGKASAQDTLSLENYDFDKAVDFFANSEELRRNEILQQFSNGKERTKYRESNLSAGELADIVKQKRREIAEGVASGELAPSKKSLSNNGEAQKTYGRYNIMGKDVALDIAPVQETANDIAPTSQPVAQPAQPVQTTQPAQPMAKDIAPTREYEAIRPKPEKPATSDIAPEGYGDKLVRVDNPNARPGENQRKWVGTSTESEAVGRKILPEDLDQDLIHYQPISNKKTLGNANAKLDSMGYDASVAYLNSQFVSNKVTLDDIALGERLIQEAVKKGDTKTASDLIMDISILGTELGQKVQALSIIKRLTPEGQLKMLQRTVERGKAKGDKAYDGVVLTQEIIDKILKVYGKDGTYDQNALNKAVEEAKRDVAKQMKVTAMDKVNAWRYLSMLGNPKTHIRNIVSNVAMRGTVAVKNAVARTGETVVDAVAKMGGKHINRTKTWIPATKSVRNFAKQTAMEMKDIISGDGKYSEDASIKEMRRIFKSGIINAPYEFNSNALSTEDWWFSRPAFINTLSEFLTANGVKTEADIQNNPDLINQAKLYATKQAEIATFRQASWLANQLNRIEKHNTISNIAVSSILPFKKTPINIAKTALNYSPLGFTKSIFHDAAQVKNGKMDASELIDNLSQNFTGTALTIAGFLLAQGGFLNGAGEDDKEGEYDYQLGEQSYSINIGDQTFSLSWLSPVAMPLFVGANAYEQLVLDKEWNPDVVIDTLAQTLDPLSEMSFLSGLDTVLSSYESGMGKVAGIGEAMTQNYVSQFIPTFSSQIAQVTDSTKRSSKVSADSSWRIGEQMWNNIRYKIPGLRQTLEPQTDIWGREVKQTENILARGVETFLAPWSRREDISTGVDDTIKGVYSETGADEIIPSIPGNSFTYDKEKYQMSASEFTEYKKTYGQTAYRMLGELFDTRSFNEASDDEKAEMIGMVYDYARDEARRKFLRREGARFTNATKDGTEYYRENAIKGAIEHDMTPEEYKFYRDYPEKYKLLQDEGVSVKEYNAFDDDTKDAYTWANKYPDKYKFLKRQGISLDDWKNYDDDTKDAYMWAYENPDKRTVADAVTGDVVEYRKYTGELYDIKADKDRNGKSISGSRKTKVAEYISDLDIDDGAKYILFKSEYPSDDTYNYDIIDYLNSRDDISYSEMKTILTELGFKVSKDGVITWD